MYVRPCHVGWCVVWCVVTLSRRRHWTTGPADRDGDGDVVTLWTVGGEWQGTHCAQGREGKGREGKGEVDRQQTVQ